MKTCEVVPDIRQILKNGEKDIRRTEHYQSFIFVLCCFSTFINFF